MTGQLRLVGDPVSEMTTPLTQPCVDFGPQVGIIPALRRGDRSAGRWALANGALLNTAEFPDAVCRLLSNT